MRQIIAFQIPWILRVFAYVPQSIVREKKGICLPREFDFQRFSVPIQGGYGFIETGVQLQGHRVKVIYHVLTYDYSW